MMDEHDIGREIERVVMGLIGMVMIGLVSLRLWRWHAGIGVYKTIWGAIAGGPIVSRRFCWDYGLWQLLPDGQLAAFAVLVIIVALIGGAVLNWRQLYFLAGIVVISGYLVNACLMIKLLADY